MTAALAALCLLPVLAGSGSAAATDSRPGTSVSPARGTSSQVDQGTRGRWSVVVRASGPEVVWRSPDRLPTMDALPVFRVGRQVVGHPRVSRSQRVLSMPLELLGAADPSELEAWIGLRRLDVRGRRLPGPAQRATGVPPASSVTDEADPGVPGPYAVTSFEYSAPDLPWPGFDAPLEVLGQAVLPVGVDHAPLVLFLHGRHIACYGEDDPGFWPCAPSSLPVPSYRGYSYLQQLLASQGYATVSISANAINAQDGVTNDGGTRARATLVRHHLALLAGWSEDPADPRWGGRLDLDRVVLVGHSRGGEGVDQAAIDTLASAPYRLRGQVLLAPTNFAHQTAPYLPTVLVLGYCDGDVSDLQGQRYVDAAPLLTDDDPALRSSVLLLGANHNYFNTEWTPGISEAPSQDDWWDRQDPVCGRRVSETRLTAAEQRRAAQTFVAAGVHAFFGDGAEAALGYLDPGAPLALPEAGPAVALSHTLGGGRRSVGIDAGASAAGLGQPCRAGQPAGDPIMGRPAGTEAEELCGIEGFARQPHWTPAAPSPASVHAADGASGLPLQEQFSWTGTPAEAGFDLTEPLDLTGVGASLDLRVVVDPRSAPVRLQVVLGSPAGSVAGPTLDLAPLPGSEWLAALWAQTVRVDPDQYAGQVDLTEIDSVRLRAVSDAGQVWLLDATLRQPGLAPVPTRSLPRVRLGRVVQEEGSSTTGGTALVPFTVIGDVTEPGRFAVAADQSTFSWRRQPQFADVTVVPGQTAGTIPVRYQADGLDDLDRQLERVHAVPKEGLVTSGFLGTVAVRDDDPAPAVTFRPARRRVHYGDDIVLRLTLESPVDYYVSNVVRAVRHPSLRPLRTSDVPRSWIRAELGSAPRDVPLSRVWHHGFVNLPPGRTTATLRVPTLAEPLHLWRKALTVRFTARQLTPPRRATVRVSLPD